MKRLVFLIWAPSNLCCLTDVYDFLLKTRSSSTITWEFSLSTLFEVTSSSLSSGNCSSRLRNCLNAGQSLIEGINASSCRYTCRSFLRSSMKLCELLSEEWWMFFKSTKDFTWKMLELAGYFIFGYMPIREAWSWQKALYFWHTVHCFPLNYTLRMYSVYCLLSTGSKLMRVCWMLMFRGNVKSSDLSFLTSLLQTWLRKH